MHYDPAELRKSLKGEGVSIEETGKDGGLFVVSGKGTLTWPSVEITVGQDYIIANGIEMKSRPDSYLNLVIEKNGHVKPGAFLLFERHWPLP